MQPKKKHGVGHNKNFGKSHTHRSLLCNASAYPLSDACAIRPSLVIWLRLDRLFKDGESATVV